MSSRLTFLKYAIWNSKTVVLIVLSLLLGQSLSAQDDRSIQWLNFEQLEDSLIKQPKKVFIDFYADWCVYCKKMDQTAFKDSKVISKLNDSYYAVKMNVESKDTIRFGGEVLINQEFGTKRNPIHDMALRLASRKGRPFSLPAIVILNKNFEVEARYFRYLSPANLQKILIQTEP
jgi:thioredoxin-related protein